MHPTGSTTLPATESIRYCFATVIAKIEGQAWAASRVMRIKHMCARIGVVGERPLVRVWKEWQMRGWPLLLDVRMER